MDGRRPVFAVDLDGTLAHDLKPYDSSKVGDPIEGAKEFLEELKKLGDILIYTCRASADVHPHDATWNARTVRKWLYDNKMPFDEVYLGNGKPFADLYIDDRAITCEPERLGRAAYVLALKAVTSALSRK